MRGDDSGQPGVFIYISAEDHPLRPNREMVGEKRGNQTHESRTDPDAKLYRKSSGRPSQLCYLGHVLMENRNGPCTDAVVTQAKGTAEPQAALEMVRPTTDARGRRVTLGADEGYDIGHFQVELIEEGIVPHIAQNPRVSNICLLAA